MQVGVKSCMGSGHGKGFRKLCGRGTALESAKEEYDGFTQRSSIRMNTPIQ